MTKLFGTMTAVALVAGFAGADDKTKADDKGKLEGVFTIVSGERDGKALPKTDFDGSVVKITDKTIVGTDKDKKEFYAATYTLDTSKKPIAISMTTTAAKGDKKDDKKPDVKDKDEPADKTAGEKMSAEGLLKVDGDTITLIYALPGGKTPTDFKTGENQQMFVLKRAEDKKEK